MVQCKSVVCLMISQCNVLLSMNIFLLLKKFVLNWATLVTHKKSTPVWQSIIHTTITQNIVHSNHGEKIGILWQNNTDTIQWWTFSYGNRFSNQWSKTHNINKTCNTSFRIAQTLLVYHTAYAQYVGSQEQVLKWILHF